MNFGKKPNDCEIEIRKVEGATKIKINQFCKKEQLESLNLRQISDGKTQEIQKLHSQSNL